MAISCGTGIDDNVLKNLPTESTEFEIAFPIASITVASAFPTDSTIPPSPFNTFVRTVPNA